MRFLAKMVLLRAMRQTQGRIVRAKDPASGLRLEGHPMPTAKQGTASIEIAAPPEVVYGLITDITRMGEWSPECYRCIWLDDADAAVPGARFRGYNKLGSYRWQTTAVVSSAEDGRLFAFTTVHDKTGRQETAWRYELQATLAGTMLTESYQFLWCPVANRLIELPIPRSRQVGRGMRQTLVSIKVAAEAAGTPAPAAGAGGGP